MKTIRYVVKPPYVVTAIKGEIEIDDDATTEEISAAIIEDAQVSVDWEEIQ